MVRILVHRQGGEVRLIHVSGHAQMRRLRGNEKDLICAAVSVTMENLLQGLSLIGHDSDALIDEKESSVRVIADSDPKEQLLVQTAYQTLKGIAEDHEKYVEMHEMEV